ncbi:hypothetical protein, partial [Salmonella enterica]|uniref:hypothetical protein n=1 Tax=Salmonella enterica TaxID=28901 RepID=UPI001C4DDEFB
PARRLAKYPEIERFVEPNSHDFQLQILRVGDQLIVNAGRTDFKYRSLHLSLRQLLAVISWQGRSRRGGLEKKLVEVD